MPNFDEELEGFTFTLTIEKKSFPYVILEEVQQIFDELNDFLFDEFPIELSSKRDEQKFINLIQE